MRRAASVDANQPQIVKAFRHLGCSVQPLHTIGHGCLDLLVGYHGESHVVEVKNGTKPPSARKLTPDEQRWWDNWRGDKHIVETLDDVKRLVCQWGKWTHAI